MRCSLFTLDPPTVGVCLYRREFAMISETVNLAQRLMSARKDRRLLSKIQVIFSIFYFSNKVQYEYEENATNVVVRLF